MQLIMQSKELVNLWEKPLKFLEEKDVKEKQLQLLTKLKKLKLAHLKDVKEFLLDH